MEHFIAFQDTLANAWLLPELLDVEADVSDPAYHRPQPLHSWYELWCDSTIITLLC